jgi:hypothetical protein
VIGVFLAGLAELAESQTGFDFAVASSEMGHLLTNRTFHFSQIILRHIF